MIKFFKRAIRRIRIKRNIYLVNKVYAGTDAKKFEKKRKLLNAIGFNIAEGTKIVGPIYAIGVKLTIGKNCWIGKNFMVNGNGSVTIGDNCDIVPEVTFLTGGHSVGDQTRRAGEGESYDIRVGDGTWIGARSTVLGNTKIGRGCVIAACACVNKDVEENTMVGGVPAKRIKELTTI